MTNVLLVDDAKDLVSCMSEYFKVIGLEVTAYAATDASGAFSIIKKHPIHLSFIDYIMPRVRGFDVLKVLHHHHPACHGYIWSGLCTPEIKNAARDLGARGFIEKPFHPMEIVKIVKDYVENVNCGAEPLPFMPAEYKRGAPRILSNQLLRTPGPKAVKGMEIN